MIDPEDFEQALNPKNWSVETTLHTPTFEATIRPDGTLWLSGAAMREGFSVEAAQALTRFLLEQITFPPEEPPDDPFQDDEPQRVI